MTPEILAKFEALPRYEKWALAELAFLSVMNYIMHSQASEESKAARIAKFKELFAFAETFVNQMQRALARRETGAGEGA